MYETLVGAIYEARAWKPGDRDVQLILDDGLSALMQIPPVEGWDDE